MLGVMGLLSEKEKEIQSRQIVERVLEWSVYRKSRGVAVYVSLPNEVATNSLLNAILMTNKTCYVPRLEKDSTGNSHLRLVQLASVDELYQSNKGTSSPFGLVEPPATFVKSGLPRPEGLTSVDLDLVLVPGLAFDTNKRRLGRGKGYYDRYLAQLQMRPRLYPYLTVPTVAGLAFTQQIIPQVPTQDHDQALDAIITPAAIF